MKKLLKFQNGTKMNLFINKDKKGFFGELIVVLDGEERYQINLRRNGFNINLEDFENKTIDVIYQNNSIYDNEGKEICHYENLFDDNRIAALYKVKKDRAVVYIGQHILAVLDINAELPKGLFNNRKFFRVNISNDKEWTIVRYANLHQHTEYSLFDGIVKIPELAKKIEYSSAITDHGNMYGFREFKQEFEKYNKQAIIGCEFYIETLGKKGNSDLNNNQKPENLNGEHLIVLAKNNTGISNLFKLSTYSFENFYFKPHITYDLLEECKEGLIVTSACIGSTLGQSIYHYLYAMNSSNVVFNLVKSFGYDFYNNEGYIKIKNAVYDEYVDKYIENRKRAKEFIDKMISLFGEDFYLEIQNHHFDTETMIMDEVRRIQKEEYPVIKMVAGVDAHYLNKEDAYTHEVWLCNQTKKTMSDETRMKFSGDGYYVHTSDEMVELFKDDLDLLDNTLEISEKVHYEVEKSEYHLPIYPLPEGFDNDAEYLTYMCHEGFKHHFEGTEKMNDEVYLKRLQTELDTIIGMGWPSYFLIVQDFIAWAKDDKVSDHMERYFPSNKYNHSSIPEHVIKDYKILVGPGRGSAAGSLVSYCLGITDVDPVKYDLLFERFLNPDRISMPDIDTDVEDSGRQAVLSYVRYKYGSDHVSGIITFGTAAAKDSVKRAARCLGYEPAFGDSIAKMISDKPGTKLKNAINENSDLQDYINSNPDVKGVIDIALKWEGLKTNASQHACFNGDTLVKTSNGFKKISEIKIGEKVLTHNGRYKSVVELFKNKSQKQVVIKAMNSEPIVCTLNHKFLVRERLSTKIKKLKNDTFWKEAKNLNPKLDYIGIPKNLLNSDNIELNKQQYSFWWIIGRYLGDGWTELRHHKKYNTYEKQIIISVGYQDIEGQNLLVYHLSNLNMKFRIENARTIMKYYINPKNKNAFYNWLQLFGKYAYGKVIPGFVINLNYEFQKAIIDGYLSADGHYCVKQNTYSFKTVSRELAYGMVTLINNIYNVPCSFYITEPRDKFIEGRLVKAKKKYSITFRLKERSKSTFITDDMYIWVPVKKVSFQEKEMDVYNIAVLDDNSYTVGTYAVHNCGYIVSDKSIVNYMPQCRMKNSKTDKYEWVTQVEGPECENLGCLKMDFLGLRTLGYVHETLNSIEKNTGKHIIYDDIPLNDTNVYQFLSHGETASVFQLESAMFTSLVTQAYQDVDSKVNSIINDKSLSEEEMKKKLQSFGDTCFSRLVDMNALVRPGPNAYINEYCNNIMHPDQIQYDIDLEKTILDSSYGIILYQEQVMNIVKKFAGFSAGQSDLIRKAMGKKKKEIIDEYSDYFVHGNKAKNINGCVNNGIEETKAINLWKKMEKFCEYAFNKSHAVSYSLHSYRTAWLAYYYPYEYMTAVLNSYYKNAEKIQQYLNTCNKKEIKVLPPSINDSELYFSTNGEAIRIGLAGLRNVGEAGNNVLNERKNGKFSDLADFLYRMAKYQQIDKRMLESFVYSGMFDEYSGSRKDKIGQMELMLRYISTVKDLNKISYSIFDAYDSAYNKKLSERKSLEISISNSGNDYNNLYKLLMEKKYAGMYISGHPMDEYRDIYKKEKVTEIDYIYSLLSNSNDDEVEYKIETSEEAKKLLSRRTKIAGLIQDLEIKHSKKGNAFYVFNLEDFSGQIKVTYFPKNNNDSQIDSNIEYLLENEMVILEGKVKQDDFGISFMAQNISSLKSQKTELDHSKKNIVIKLPENSDAVIIMTAIYDLQERMPKGNKKIFTVQGDKKTVLYENVYVTPSIAQELVGIVGSENISYQ